MTQPHQPVLIAGTGAMACLFAARLSAARIPVTMLGSWRQGIEALRQDGVRLVEADGREQAYPVQVIQNELECRYFDVVLVMVKSWQTARVARQLTRCMDPDAVALTLQNGLGNYEVLVQALGAPRVALGTTTTGANLIGPGRVQAAGEGVISLGFHPRLGPVTDRLRAAGFIVENAPDANVLLWGKLVINAAINPLTALLQIHNGELLERSTARALMAAVAREAAAVAVAQGIPLPYPDPVTAAESIARRTAANRSSMLQDVQRGAPTEIDAICGAIVQAGEQRGVATPVNRTLWMLVKALQNNERGAQ